MKANGGVVQAVALDGYVNREKNQKFNEANNAVLKEIAGSMDFEIIPWREVRKLEEKEQEAYFETYMKVRKLARERIDEVKAIAEPVNVADFIDHIDYLVEKIGIDHVGISSDFDGGGGVDGWTDASETMNVTIELVRRGYTEEEIAKLWNGNLLRVLDEVQKVAAEIQASES
jgi:microsomal dipeptidase-like Zn-dependent dipeptidase